MAEKDGIPKSILFLCSFNSISGGLIMIFEHAYRLQQRGYDTCITFRYADKKTPNSVFPHGSELKIIDYGSRTDFDVVVATFWSTVYSLVDFNARHYAYFVQSDERLFYEESDPNVCWADLTYSIPGLAAVTSALWLSDFLADEFNTDSFHVPNGLHLSMFHPKEAEPAPAIRVLIEGSGKTWFKRIDDAFRTAKGVSGIELWYVTSDGYVSPEWRPDRVFKKVPYNEMPAIYQSCDILLKMSEIESFGLPNLEMMACGGAVITTAFNGHEEYAVDGENAFVVEVGDVKTATERLQQLVESPELRKKFGENGIDTAQLRNWDTLKPGFADAIKRMESDYPMGSTKYALPKLKALSRAFREHEARMGKLQYLEDWRQGIAKRERALYYRVASKIHRLLGRS